jgi:hypothetical protein
MLGQMSASVPRSVQRAVTLADKDAGWLEKGSAEAALNRFALPVTHLVVNS